jgi:hypothetical protein
MGSRRLAALASVVLTVLGGVFLLSPRCASACQCTMPVEKPTLAESSAVFSGEVVKIDQPSPFKSGAALETDTFRVYEVWKGTEQKTLVVHTALMGMSCGYPLRRDKSIWSTPIPGSKASKSGSATVSFRSPRRGQSSGCWEPARSRRSAGSSPTPLGAYRRARWWEWRVW